MRKILKINILLVVLLALSCISCCASASVIEQKTTIATGPQGSIKANDKYIAVVDGNAYKSTKGAKIDIYKRTEAGAEYYCSVAKTIPDVPAYAYTISNFDFFSNNVLFMTCYPGGPGLNAGNPQFAYIYLDNAEQGVVNEAKTQYNTSVSPSRGYYTKRSDDIVWTREYQPTGSTYRFHNFPATDIDGGLPYYKSATVGYSNSDYGYSFFEDVSYPWWHDKANKQIKVYSFPENPAGDTPVGAAVDWLDLSTLPYDVHMIRGNENYVVVNTSAYPTDGRGNNAIWYYDLSQPSSADNKLQPIMLSSADEIVSGTDSRIKSMAIEGDILAVCAQGTQKLVVYDLNLKRCIYNGEVPGNDEDGFEVAINNGMIMAANANGGMVLYNINGLALGFSAAADTYYSMEKAFSKLPSTFEATVNFPATIPASERGGVIMGNYYADGEVCLNFEIYSGGSPRIYMVDETGKSYSLIFDGVNIYNGKNTHIAVAIDSENSQAHCYINGELKQTLSYATPSSLSFGKTMFIGGDRRNGNARYCKGKIFDLAIYDEARTASQIESDYTGGYEVTEDMMAYYDMNNPSSELIDMSGSGNNARLNQTWLDEVALPEDFSYSFAVVGDTQNLARYYPQYMTKIYDWIIDNADENKTKFVFGLGDITDTNTAAEWAVSKAVIQKLDGVVPYSFVRGNHDEIPEYNMYMSYSDFGGRIAGTYDGTMLNTYQYLTVNGIKYLIFGLDYGAADSVLNWASGIIEQNKDCNVIITTHAYLYRDGTTLDSGDVWPPSLHGGYNDGDDMWEKLIKNHENIVLVLSGHDPCDNVVLRQEKGDNGNVVSQMLIDPQDTDLNHSGTGLVAMLYFSEDGKNVTVRYYSTVKNKYFMADNQYSFEMDVIEADNTAPVTPETEINGISFNVSLTADAYEGKIFAALYDEFGKVTSVKTYDVAENVPVSFDEDATGKQIKVFWWNGVDTIVPVCLPEVIDVIN